MSDAWFTGPTMDAPATIFDELLDEIRSAVNGTARNVQRRIGPSGIGTGCPRWLLHMLAQDAEPEGKTKWQAGVGTMMHSGFEQIMRNSPSQTASDGPRWLIEQVVTVGTIGGETITGHMDLYDLATGTVIDWKTVSKSQADKQRRAIANGQGPGSKYEIQAHTYGLGMLYAGHAPKVVMDVFVPRDGELRDSFYWAAPFDPQIALAAIERCNGLMALINNSAVGLHGALEMFKDAPCGDWFCPWCPKSRRASSAPDDAADPFGLGDQIERKTG